MTTFKKVSALGLNVFYREAGDPGSPKLLLLGGFPSSSHQFRNLLPSLADQFHLASFDYPGFGNTDMPEPPTWDYTFTTWPRSSKRPWRPSASPVRWGSTCRTTAARSATA
ncbi:MAG: hypothetical protein QOG28_890 [Trebonia sp.]|nr:hypothetical protein [Trebonia sp.]